MLRHDSSEVDLALDQDNRSFSDLTSKIESSRPVHISDMRNFPINITKAKVIGNTQTHSPEVHDKKFIHTMQVSENDSIIHNKHDLDQRPKQPYISDDMPSDGESSYGTSDRKSPEPQLVINTLDDNFTVSSGSQTIQERQEMLSIEKNYLQSMLLFKK